MFIPRIFRPSAISIPKARARRLQSAGLFGLETLENRTALSGGVNIGFAAALISRLDHFSSADFGSVSPIDIDIAIEKATVLDSAVEPALSDPLEFGVQPNGPNSTGGSSFMSTDLIGPASPVFAEGQSTAPFAQPTGPAAALQSDLSANGPWSGIPVENTLILPAIVSIAVDSPGLEPAVALASPSHETQTDDPGPNPNMTHDGFFPMPMRYFLNGGLGDPEEINIAPPAVRMQLSQVDLNAISDPDVSVLGSLMPPDSDDSSSTMMTAEFALGRACGLGFGVISSGLSIQMNGRTDPAVNGWMSYVANGDLAGSDSQSSDLRGDVLSSPDVPAGEPIEATSITTGELPVSVLLSGPDTLAQDSPDRLEQVAELIPLKNASLALVATLWTVSSDAAATDLGSNGDVDDANLGLEVSSVLATSTPPSWTVFVIGLNEAFEQSQRDVEQGCLSSPRTLSGGEQGRDEQEIPWRGPIVPASAPEVFETANGPRRAGQTAARNQRLLAGSHDASSVCGSVPSSGESHDPVEGSAIEAREAQTATLASLPMISAVSAVGVFVGWLWTNRARLGRMRVTTNR